jgi:hypothetical protein
MREVRLIESDLRKCFSALEINLSDKFAQCTTAKIKRQKEEKS